MPRKLVRKGQAPPDATEAEDPVEQIGQGSSIEEAPGVVYLQERDRPQPLLYDVTDACYVLGKISKPMLYKLVNLKEITPLKLGTRSVFTREELERFIREKQDQQRKPA